MEVTLRWGVSGGEGAALPVPGALPLLTDEDALMPRVVNPRYLFLWPRMIVAFHTLLKQDGANKYGVWAL